MKSSTKAAVASGARKVVAILFCAMCSAQLVDNWYDWFWVAFFVLSQWALHFEAERLLLRQRLRALKKQPINQSINVSVPEANPTIQVVAPPWGGRRSRRSVNTRTVSIPAKTTEDSEPITLKSSTLKPSTQEESPSVLQRLSQIDISSFGRIFKNDPDEVVAKDDEGSLPITSTSTPASPSESALIADMRREELVSALRNLGYRNTAQSIADFVISESPDADLETLIRAALRLSRKK